MKRLSLAGVIVVGVSTLWILRHGTVAGGADANPAGGRPRKVLYYRDPMHPAYTSDRPGKAPDCGMALQPVYAEENDSKSSQAIPGSSLVTVDPGRQQMIGVRTGRVERTRTTDQIRTIGRVVADENRLFPVIAAGEGWVTSIAPGMATGNTVRRGQRLMSISGRDYTNAQRTYLYALRAAESRAPAGTSNLQDQPDLTLQEAGRALQGMGLAEAQLQQLATARQPVLDIPLTAAEDGVIVSRTVFPRQRFVAGTELFRIADLRKVWIEANISSRDEGLIRGGTVALVSLPDQQDPPLRAIVADAGPRADPTSRTIALRLHVDNPRLLLRPDRVVDLVFPISLPEATTVPSEAVIDSGLRSTVFVDRGNGVFEPRTVETGWRVGDRVQILRGLEQGESIAVSGSFLLDSESRIRRGNAREHD